MQAWNISSTIKQGNWCLAHKHLGLNSNILMKSMSMNKTSGGDGIEAELFQVLKDDAVKVLHSIYQQICKTQSGHRTGKDPFSFQSQRKAMPKNIQTTTRLHSFNTLPK